MEFPFNDAPNTAAITCSHVAEGHKTILYVSHDEEDGMWQFLCGKQHEESEARIVSLYSVFMLDHSIAELAGMPYGYVAERVSKETEWSIRKK